MAGVLEAVLRLRAFASLRYRDCRLLSVSQGFGTMGMWMDEVARGWLIYQLTDSALQLGLVRGAQAIVYLVLSPLAGSFADRYSRRTQLTLAQFLNGLVFAWLAALIFAGTVAPWHVYLTAVMVAMVQVFQQPARSAMLSDTVPKEYLTNAIGLSALIFNVARTVGPALAGVLIVVWGTGGAFAVQALCLFLAAWSTWMIGGGRAAPRSGNKESFAHSIAEGWRFSLRNEAVRAGLLVTMITHFLIVPFTTLLPVFARDLLQVGANGQGLMLTAMGIGALVSAGLLASAGHRLPRGQLMLGASIIYGFIVAAFAASSWFALSLALMFATGLCQVCTNALVQTIIQSNSPPEFRGRVMAIFSMNMVLVTAGAVVYAALAEFAGPRWAVAAMGIAGSLAMLAMYFLMPRAKAIR